MSDDDDTSDDRYAAFLRGDRPDDILIYLHEEGVGSIDELAEIGVRVDDGVVLVLPGRRPRRVPASDRSRRDGLRRDGDEHRG